MTKQYKLKGTITLDIEMTVECDSTKIAPSEFAENLILQRGYVDLTRVAESAIKVRPVVTKCGAIEFHDVEEINSPRKIQSEVNNEVADNTNQDEYLEGIMNREY